VPVPVPVPAPGLCSPLARILYLVSVMLKPASLSLAGLAPSAAAVGVILAGTVTLFVWNTPEHPPRVVVARGLPPATEWTDQQIPPLPEALPAPVEAPKRALPRPPAHPVAAPLPTIREADFRRAVNERMGDVQRCYHEAFRGSIARPGRIAVRIQIDATGAVLDSVPVTDTVRDPDVAACVAASVRRAHFPPPGGTVQYTFPFVFQPGS